MTDQEIKQYLNTHHWAVDAQDAFMDIFNTSSQIVDEIYDFDSHMMTIVTPENTFTFKWLLGNPMERK